MNLSLLMACGWGVAANVLAMIPSSDNHWSRAYVLIAIGIPIVGYVTYQNGPIWGLLILGAGASVLRWPVRYLWRWVSGKFQRGGA